MTNISGRETSVILPRQQDQDSSARKNRTRVRQPEVSTLSVAFSNPPELDDAVSEWRARFRSFHSDSMEKAKRVARSAAGRKLLSEALCLYALDRSSGRFVDYDEFDMVGYDLAKVWPKAVGEPDVRCDTENQLATKAASVLLSGFKRRILEGRINGHAPDNHSEQKSA